MDTVKINKHQAKMIAHRGLSGLERENTNVAFVAAGQRTHFGIETDVYRTVDAETETGSFCNLDIHIINPLQVP